MDFRGQGAIEYLLIIGAAILVVAIVILAVTGVLSGGQQGVGSGTGTLNNANNLLGCQSDLNHLGAATGTTCKNASGTYPAPKTSCVCCTTFTAAQLPNCK